MIYFSEATECNKRYHESAKSKGTTKIQGLQMNSVN